MRRALRRDARRTVLAAAVALLLTGCGGGEEATTEEAGMAVEPGAAMDTTPAGTPAPPDPEVQQAGLERHVTAELREWQVELSRDTVPAGEITFNVLNTGAVQHALEVEGQGIEQETAQIPPGGTATLTVALQPGTYEIYCPVETQGTVHEQRGMRTTLTVVPAGPASR